MTFWPELVDLFEYRVTDALNGRVPKGGRRSLGELREELLSAPLEPALLRRVIMLDREYRAHLKARYADRTHGTGQPLHLDQADHVSLLPTRMSPATAVVSSGWVTPVQSDSPELRAWDDLHLMVWREQFEAALQELLVTWQREPNLLTLRVLFTVIENAERSRQVSGAPLPVPSTHDPLVSLHDREVVQHVVTACVELAQTADGRKRLQNALSAVHEEPFPRHPDEDVVSARVAALERENITAEARSVLVNALRDQYHLNRDVRERPAIRDAVRTLNRQLEPLLGSVPHPSVGAVPGQSILYAEHPRSALRQPNDGSTELLIYLRGGQATRWRGVDFRWQYIKPNWQLHAGNSQGDQVVLLRPQEHGQARTVQINLTSARFRALVSDAYLMLRAETKPEEELARRAALGRAVAYLLNPAEAFGYLRLSRAAALLLRDGRLDPSSLDEQSSEKYLAASPDALLNFARKGALSLTGRMVKLTPGEIRGVLREAARHLNFGLGPAEQLAEVLVTATHAKEDLPAPVNLTRMEIVPDGKFASMHLPEEPLTLQVGRRAITLRQDFKGDLAAVLPGHAALILRDLLVIRMPEVSVILVRDGRWLAAAALTDEQVRPQDAGNLLHTRPYNATQESMVPHDLPDDQEFQ